MVLKREKNSRLEKRKTPIGKRRKRLRGGGAEEHHESKSFSKKKGTRILSSGRW